MTDLNIILENQDFIIINKPADLSFHNQDNQAGVFNLVQSQLKIKIWPVHRLDKITSGVLMFAKSLEVATLLGELFEKKQISKTYIAISDRKPNKKQGKVVGDMQKSRGGNWKLVSSRNNPATTQFLSRSLLPGKRVFWIKPLTGKTHQIRVALKSLGSPIIGDQRYSGCSADRGYLHAYKLSFQWRGSAFAIKCLPTQGELFLIAQLSESIQYFENQP